MAVQLSLAVNFLSVQININGSSFRIMFKIQPISELRQTFCFASQKREEAALAHQHLGMSASSNSPRGNVFFEFC